MPHLRSLLLSTTAILPVATLAVLALTEPGLAACVTGSTDITCDSSAPNPWTTTVGQGNTTAADNWTVNITSGANIVAGDANAISFHDNNTITVSGTSTVSANATSGNGGGYGNGRNTVEFRNNNTFTIDQGGQVLSLGTAGDAEAINFMGTGNTVVNNGTIRADNAVAIWSQNTTGINTVINNGVIQSPGTVIGGSGNGALDFTNRGMVIGNITLAGGDDILRLFTGSSIAGNFSGGAGDDAIFLSGDGSASLPGNMSGFESLTKNGTGTWELTGTVTGVTVSTVQEGTLILSGDNTNYTGQVIVDPAGTLQARAQSLPPTVTNNGLVRFNQPDDGTYSGLISGTGVVEKTGVGVLTLTSANTYSGGTRINQGTIAISQDSALGDAGGPVTFNGGTLQLDASFDLAATRQVVLNAPGGTIDTQGFDTTLAQGASGEGMLTKTGTGTLVFAGENTYTGGTTISAGTLQLGNGGTTGSILGDVANNGALAFNRSDAYSFAGLISGSGAVDQAGAGTTILTADNSYTGGTTILAGTLQLGNGGTTGAITGDVTNNGTLAFNRSNLYLFDGVISGSGAIRQIGSGLTRFTGDSSGFAGTTSVEAGTLSVNGSLCGDMNVLAGGRLQGIGTVCDTDNAGTVAPGNSIGTLTVAGNYTGNGGTLEIETVLEGDDSATDRLVVTGDTSGSTNVHVINLGGNGAQTVEGIKIIDIGGTSNGAFSLLGDYVFQGDQAVVGGAYAYRLYKNGIATPNDGDWYLRSDLINSPDPDPLPQPLYQAGVPLYEAYAGTLQSFNQLGTLQQRVGNRSWSVLAQGVDGVSQEMATEPKLGVWGRIEAAHGRFEPKTSTSGTDYDAAVWKLQTGMDMPLASFSGGQLIGGINLHYGTVSSGIDSVFGTGKIDTTGYGLGGTLTFYGDDGFYVDGQAQATWYDSDLFSRTAELALASGNDGTGHALSIEVGQRFAIAPEWSVTPQAQLAWSKVKYDGFTDPFGAAVSLDKSDALVGRLGLTLDRQTEWRDAAGQTSKTHLYGIANLYYDFRGTSTVEVAGTAFDSENEALWGGIGTGGTYSWSDGKYALYGETLVRTSLNQFADSYTLSATLGFRAKW
ncbi:autotransporter outer membrane beta-barrel domain-containing protein [Ensifer sp. LCM 4579]|uniref:autotransporter outer membrane beta-barrel domain-containing protein n=1 Tax=Ensifer sp. LCM 4579 TaxID=1848292 RepID=UPI0008DA8C2E|nr:autotransporter outer membrane beta-barrel domain-containing protein [Ensifer sp. LCM 4579]OHV72809.1 hypothetical protein LCM4579_12035 [Ensifer sp. LCM 4579]